MRRVGNMQQLSMAPCPRVDEHTRGNAWARRAFVRSSLLRGHGKRTFAHPAICGVETMTISGRMLLVGVAMLTATPAMADAVSDFYRGKQMRFIVRTTPGGDYDQYTRLLARFMG